MAAPASQRRQTPGRPATDGRLRLVVAVLALAGLGVAGYHTYVRYVGLKPFCAGGGGGCERVQSSS